MWGIALDLSCKGYPSVCGPWNGRCPVRAKFLEANLLPEPRWFGDHADQLQWMRERFGATFDSQTDQQPLHPREVWKAIVERAAAQPSPSANAETDQERESRIRQEMEEYARRKRRDRGRDFDR